MNLFLEASVLCVLYTSNSFLCALFCAFRHFYHLTDMLLSDSVGKSKRASAKNDDQRRRRKRKTRLTDVFSVLAFDIFHCLRQFLSSHTYTYYKTHFTMACKKCKACISCANFHFKVSWLQLLLNSHTHTISLFISCACVCAFHLFRSLWKSVCVSRRERGCDIKSL